MTTVRNNAEPRSDVSHWRPLLAWLALSLAALATFRPYHARPFSIVDFSEFLPILEQSTTFGERIADLLQYYGTHGRFNPVYCISLALQWSVFGDWSVGWQLTRASVMLAVVFLTYALLRRLNTSQIGAFIGACVFLWSPAATESWIRLSMSEPLATLAALAASLQAITFQSTQRWGNHVLVIGLAAVVIIWSKELLAPLILLPLALALLRQADGRFRAPSWDRRNLALLGVTALALIAAFVPVGWAYLHTADESYARLYGDTIHSPLILVMFWVLTLVPFDLLPPGASIPWALGVVGFVALAFGWRVAFSSRAASVSARWLLACSLLLPLLGVLAYAPVQRLSRFYTLPYLVGSSLLLGLGASYLERAIHRTRALVVSLAICTYASSIGSAATTAAREEATQLRNDAVLDRVAGLSWVDSVLVAGPWVLPPSHAWMGVGPTFYRFAAATDRPWPPSSDVDCERARQMLLMPLDVIVLELNSVCNLRDLGEVHGTIVRRFRRLRWDLWRWVPDSMYALLLVPRMP